jgi:hypothetical protein
MPGSTFSLQPAKKKEEVKSSEEQNKKRKAIEAGRAPLTALRGFVVPDL